MCIHVCMVHLLGLVAKTLFVYSNAIPFFNFVVLFDSHRKLNTVNVSYSSVV